MPTGYTAEVADGKVSDFRTFALRCARNFGATIMQRDNPADEPPKHREISSFYAQHVEQAKARSAEVATMTLDDAAREAKAAHVSAMESYNKSMAERTQTRNRYNAMLAEVIAWRPPTLDHQRMKDFMIEQLKESRKFDCDFTPSMPVPKAPETWLADAIALADRDLDRSTQSLAEELERCAKANAWIDALYASLPAEAT